MSRQPHGRMFASELTIRHSIEKDGFTVIESFVPAEITEGLCAEVDTVDEGEPVRSRRGRTFAVRNALDLLPAARRIANLDAVRRLAAQHLPESAEPRVVRAILFDKNLAANWKVPWHQDVTIAVQERIDAPGFGPWSVKAGVVHVQPPAEVLGRMITLRIALDDCDESNGPLLVLPGTHRNGFLDQAAIEHAREMIAPIPCTCRAGDIVIMRPLVLHASSSASNPRRRRVLHLEFAGEALPGGLKWVGASRKKKA